MSRFVPEGKSDLKSLQSKEFEANERYKNEQEEQDTLSLYDQMKLNHIAKEQEFEDKVKSKNQSHILSEREINFYSSLEKKVDDKTQSRKKEIEEGLKSFEASKKNKITKPEIKAKTTAHLDLISNGVVKGVKILKKVNTKKAIAKSKEPKKISIVGNYESDSDSDSD